MQPYRRRTTVTLLAVLAIAAGCGPGGDGDATDGEGRPTALEIAATEFAFDPADVTAVADRAVSVTLENNGSIEHEWVVLTAGTSITSEDEFAEDLVAFELEADPAEVASGSFTLPAGSHQVICAVPGHFAAGMHGSLTLE